MEVNGKRRGFKGKLMMFMYRAPKSSTVQVSSKVKPTPSTPTASFGYVGEDEFPNPEAKLMASSVKKEGGDYSVGTAIGGNFVTEDTVDKRAAAYIASVHERFKLQQMD